VFDGDERWRGLPVPTAIASRGIRLDYIRRAPYFDGIPPSRRRSDFAGHGCCACSETAHHGSHLTAGSIRKTLPAGQFFWSSTASRRSTFNSYGARRATMK